jgi:hypothetical protein
MNLVGLTICHEITCENDMLCILAVIVVWMGVVWCGLSSEMGMPIISLLKSDWCPLARSRGAA